MSEKRMILRSSVATSEMVKAYAEMAGLNAGQAVDRLIASGFNRMKASRECEMKRRAEKRRAKEAV